MKSIKWNFFPLNNFHKNHKEAKMDFYFLIYHSRKKILQQQPEISETIKENSIKILWPKWKTIKGKKFPKIKNIKKYKIKNNKTIFYLIGSSFESGVWKKAFNLGKMLKGEMGMKEKDLMRVMEWKIENKLRNSEAAAKLLNANLINFPFNFKCKF